jgi:flagellar assembly protein FliH
MGAPAKFLFDDDFAQSAAGRDGMTSTAFAARLAEAEQKGFRNGFAAAQTEAAADTQRRLATALDRISHGINTIAGGLGDITGRMETEAVDVAIATARQICDQLISREPLAEMTALIEECFSHLVATPHLVVRVNETLYDGARARIEDLARKFGFEGRLVILAEADIESGDCRIEWADGGIVRERGATEAKITELVSRYLAARHLASGA